MALETHSTVHSTIQNPTGLGDSLINAPIDLHPALEAVRQMKEFQPPRPGLLDELLKHPLLKQLSAQAEALMNQLTKALQRLFGQVHLPGVANLPDNMRDIFSGFIAFILVLMGLYAFYILLGWLLKIKTRKAKAVPDVLPGAGQALLVSAEHHYAQALKASRKNRYPDAVRQLYLATLCLLDEQSVVPFETARSNLEYIRALAQQSPVDLKQANLKQSDLKAAFIRVAHQFEAARYGNQPVQNEQWQQCEQDYRQLRTQVNVDD